VSIGESVSTHEGSLLWTLEEIGRLISESGNPAETLTNIVHLIQRRFTTDVCSVYLLEPDRTSLVLAATIGLRPESVGRVRMRLTEGLVGLVAEQLTPQVVADATSHPRFKYFPATGEIRTGRRHRSIAHAAGRPSGRPSNLAVRP
jgi:signal transduction protein with GAF and PtsI domain